VTRRVGFRPEAEAEARDWYEGRRPGLGAVFRAALDKALDGIAANPIMFQRVMTEPPFDQDANRLLARHVEDLPPGAALDIAAGQGRNAVFLAAKGWQVTAFDISGKGLEIAKTAAREAGVRLTTVRCSAQEFDYGHQAWDLVLLV
jgi:2-polyprenyl-3-methyl-5-hydroxy-6-metoxy-1,4-benzoquinol methylase